MRVRIVDYYEAIPTSAFRKDGHQRSSNGLQPLDSSFHRSPPSADFVVAPSGIRRRQMTDRRLRPDNAGQLVPNTHDYAHNLPGAQRRAGRRAEARSADFDPARPDSGVNVRVEGVVLSADRSADQLIRNLRCTTGIVDRLAAQAAIAAPVRDGPSVSVEKVHIDA